MGKKYVKKKTLAYQFSDKHRDYIRRCEACAINVAEGAVRAGKTTDNVFAFAHAIKNHPDKIHLATGSTAANAMLNIGDCDGFGLEHIFRGQSHWGKYKGNTCLYIRGPSTGFTQKIVIFAGGGLANSYKKIRGNSYGMWIATEINLHHDNTIKEANNRLLASKRLKIFWDLNPDHPKAPIYTDYIDKYADQEKAGVDIGGYNYMHCTIHDNVTISEESKQQTINRYDKGSIWYLRDILGQRCIAEGLIYRAFADRRQTGRNRVEQITVEKVQELARGGKLQKINIGIDFGGNGSAHAFVATATTRGYKQLIALSSVRYEDSSMTSNKLGELFVEFFRKILNTYGFVTNIYADSAETVLINSLQESLKEAGLGGYKIKNAAKRRVNDRIYTVSILMGSYRLLYTEDCETLVEALCTTIWDPKKLTENERLDDGTCDIDSQDAFEYTFERDWKKFIRAA
jgi:PBSX family phage terminase large subunit